MSFLERISGKGNGELDQFENIELHVLNIAASWEMDGLPWWTGLAMGEALEGLNKRALGTLYVRLHRMEDQGALESSWGGSSESSLHSPASKLLRVDGKKLRYYRITSSGREMRSGIVEEASGHAVDPSTLHFPA